MNAPHLIPLRRAAPGVRAHFPRTVDPDRLYVVVEGGTFCGRRWDSGELLETEQSEEGLAILVPRGVGRVRLGTVCGNRLYGDSGEPCLAERWSVAGRVRAVHRPAGDAWSSESLGRSQMAA